MSKVMKALRKIVLFLKKAGTGGAYDEKHPRNRRNQNGAKNYGA